MIGMAIKANLISGFDSPFGITLDGAGHLFVVDNGPGTIGEYDASSGVAINAQGSTFA